MAISTRAEPLTAIAHGFSHYRLHIHPLRMARRRAARTRCGDNADLRWVARAELRSLGLPAPVRKLDFKAEQGRHGTHRVLRSRPDAKPKAWTSCPGPAKLGKRVFAHIGKPAWQRWLAHQTMLINENRLSPLDPKHRAFLEAEMEKFLFGGGAEKPAGYVPPEPERPRAT